MAKKGTDISKLAERLAQLNKESDRGQGSNLSFLNLNDGRNVLRVLPAREDAEMFYEETWVHYGVGKTKDNKNGTMVVCPTTHDENAKCPVCELSKELYNLSKKKDDSYSKQAKSIFRKKRVYFNALSREEDLSNYEVRDVDGELKWFNISEDTEESPIKIWGTGIGIFKDILGLMVDPEYGDITDAEEGLDLIVTKTGSGQYNTKYDIKTVRKESEIGLDDWELGMHDLSQLAECKSYDEILKIMDGEDVSDDEDEDEDTDDGDTEDTSKSNDSSDDSDEDEDEDDLQAEISAALKRRRNNRK